MATYGASSSNRTSRPVPKRVRCVWGRTAILPGRSPLGRPAAGDRSRRPGRLTDGTGSAHDAAKGALPALRANRKHRLHLVMGQLAALGARAGGQTGGNRLALVCGSTNPMQTRIANAESDSNMPTAGSRSWRWCRRSISGPFALWAGRTTAITSTLSACRSNRRPRSS